MWGGTEGGGPSSLGTAAPDDKMIPADKSYAGRPVTAFIIGSDLTQEHREAGKRAKCDRIHPKIPSMTHPTP